jgi:HK97 family phage prohead protease
MKPADRFSLPIEIKLTGDGLADGEIVGYASTFGDVDSQGDMVMPGAFKVSLASHHANSTAPLLLWQHDIDQPIGRWSAVKEDSRGLLARGRLSLGVAKADDARVLARDGILGMSIGYRTVDAAYVRKVRQLRRVDLIEISLTPSPSNTAARITAAKSGIRPDTARALERALHEIGFTIREAKMMAPAALAAIKRNDPSFELATLLEAAAQTFSLSKEKA